MGRSIRHHKEYPVSDPDAALASISCPLMPDMYFSTDGSDNGPILSSGAYWYRVSVESDAAAAKLTGIAAWHVTQQTAHAQREREVLDLADQYSRQGDKARRQSLELAAIAAARNTDDLSGMDIAPGDDDATGQD